MIDCGIPDSLWPEILYSVIKITNRTSTRTLEGAITPWEAFMDQIEPKMKGQHKPSVSHFRVLGCKSYVLIPEERRKKGNKLDERAEAGILIGFEGSHIYRVWIPSRRRDKIVRSSNVRFDERQGLVTAGEEPSRLQEASPLPRDIRGVNPDLETDDSDVIIVSNTKQGARDINKQSNVNTAAPKNPKITELDAELDPNESNVPTDTDTALAQTDQSEVTDTDSITAEIPPQVTAKRGGRPKGSKNKIYVPQPQFERITRARGKNQEPEAFAGALFAARVDRDDPLTLKQALSGPDAEKWRKALFDIEYNNLRSRNTFTVVPRSEVPNGQKVLSVKSIFKTKRDENGDIIKHKARLVVRGFEQQYGKDFDQTYAGVARGSSWKILVAFAALNDLEIEQMDAVAAFLHGDVDTVIYTKIPEGWTDENGNPIPPGMVARLNRPLYGLKQAPKLWQIKLRKGLKKLGFKQLKSDNALYINRKTMVMIATHVDDFLIIGNKKAVTEVKADLSKIFHMEDLGPAKHFVGVRIHRDRANRTISLVQDGYTDKVLERFDMQNSTPYKTPMETGAKAFLQKYEGQATKAQITEYQQIVGSELYLATHTRPDISYAVSKLSKFLTNPSPAHLKAAKRVLAYLNGTRELGITFGPGKVGDKDMSLEGYADSSYAEDFIAFKETSTESSGGYLFYLAGGVISSQTKQTKGTAQSTTEAEFYAMNAAARHAAWLQQVFDELGYHYEDAQSVLLHGDNEGALALSENPEIHYRTKHIAIQYHYIREQAENGHITLNYVGTKDMKADGLTKPLPGPNFLRFRDEHLNLKPVISDGGRQTTTGRRAVGARGGKALTLFDLTKWPRITSPKVYEVEDLENSEDNTSHHEELHDDELD